MSTWVVRIIAEKPGFAVPPAGLEKLSIELAECHGVVCAGRDSTAGYRATIDVQAPSAGAAARLGERLFNDAVACTELSVAPIIAIEVLAVDELTRQGCQPSACAPGVGAFRAMPVYAEGVVVLTLAGELDLAALPAFAEAVAACADSGGLILDLAEVTFMDSTGVSALVKLRQRLGPGETLVLRNVPRQSQRVLELTGLLDVFHLDAPSSAGARGGR
jgi:anti-sigma B factor antagonist